MDRRILDRVSEYYSGKLALHGATPRGVDWNSVQSQELRFAQLCKLLPTRGRFSLNEVGCGYGALYDYLGDNGYAVRYFGCDVSPDMVQAARRLHRGRRGATFSPGGRPPRRADYAVASGLFNVKLSVSAARWLGYVDSIIEELDRKSRFGFAFNCLTSYSDRERRRRDLYYGDPCRFFDQCKRLYSRNVALLHDYGLYEFTILVRK